MRHSLAPMVFQLTFAMVSCATAREIHVAKSGADTNRGDHRAPYLTIGKGAEEAQPGDTVIVHAGTYREWVKPPRGGTAEEARITYRAAPDGKVVVAGSERVDSWTKEKNGVWLVELPHSYFGDYNPYALNLTGGWLTYGEWHHCGDVYLNGEAFLEKETAAEVGPTQGTWHCETGDETTTVRANFGRSNPNVEQVEINVRESLFMPEVTGLKYITVDGFHFLHAASNWAPPVMELQPGAVGTRMGKHWIIENCTVVNARCVGIILGHAPGVDYTDIEAFGDHIVRNNVIRRCGEAGIAGQKGATRSCIAGNLIEETNYRKEFGGHETAAIKLHNSIDTVICGNLIRKVDRQKHAAYGIWMDFGNQGTRITGNIICDTDAAAIFLEMNHGPALIDNNVLIGGGTLSNSENTVFAHNLLIDCKHTRRPDMKRRSQYFAPHTTRVVGRKPGVPQNGKWLGNIFIRQGLDNVREASGDEADHNVFLEGARRSFFGDENSVSDSASAEFSRKDTPQGIVVAFSVDEPPTQLTMPWVSGETLGKFPTCDQTIEDRDGQPITVSVDLSGDTRKRPMPGPLAKLKEGRNTIQIGFRPGM